MNIHAYARVKNDSECEKFKQTWLGEMPGNVTFRFDRLAGQYGLKSTIKAAEREPDSMVVFAHASDAGRDLREAVLNLNRLALAENVKEVRILSSDIHLTFGNYNDAWKLVTALAGAHGHYSRVNRRSGVALAKQQGAQMGRPEKFSYDKFKHRLEALFLMEERQPSVRKVAGFLNCSTATAHKLLKERKARA